MSSNFDNLRGNPRGPLGQRASGAYASSLANEFSTGMASGMGNSQSTSMPTGMGGSGTMGMSSGMGSGLTSGMASGMAGGMAGGVGQASGNVAGSNRFGQFAPQPSILDKAAQALIPYEGTTKLAAIGMPILMANIVFVFARIAELVAITTGVVVPFYVLAIHGMALLQAMVGGGMRAVLQSKQTMIIIALCGWIGLSLPFSFYRSGSLKLFTTGWLVSFTGYFITAGSLQNATAIRRVSQMLGLSSLVMLAFSFTLGKTAEGRFSFQAGSLANANDFAALLVLGFPFLALPLLRGDNAFRQLLSAGFVGAILVVALRTGSRSGMLTIAVVLLVLFIGVGTAAKIRFSVAFAALVLCAIPFVGESTLERLKSLQGNEEATSLEEMSEAQASSTMRSALFWTAMNMAVENPIFGVGLDAFQAMENKEARESGRRGTWLSPHNSFAQMASETGLITFVLLVAFVAFGLFRINQARKLVAKVEGRSALYFLCLAYQGAFSGMAFNFNFSNNAYLPFIYMFVGMCEGIYIYTQELVKFRERTAAQPAGANGLASAGVQSSPQLISGMLPTFRTARDNGGRGATTANGQAMQAAAGAQQEPGASLRPGVDGPSEDPATASPPKPKFEQVRRLPRSMTR